jgi:hypothetical protein
MTVRTLQLLDSLARPSRLDLLLRLVVAQDDKHVDLMFEGNLATKERHLILHLRPVF